MAQEKKKRKLGGLPTKPEDEEDPPTQPTKPEDETSGPTTPARGSSFSGKREDRLSWHQYFMGLAVMAANRSKDPDTQVGCVITSQDLSVLGVGYNGFPKGISEETHQRWMKSSKKDGDNSSRNDAKVAPELKEQSALHPDQDAVQLGFSTEFLGYSKIKPEDVKKEDYVIHAETNALAFCSANRSELTEAVAYVTLFPCSECAKLLIQNGVTRIVYLSYRDKFAGSALLLLEAGVTLIAYEDLTGSSRDSLLETLQKAFSDYATRVTKREKQDKCSRQDGKWPISPDNDDMKKLRGMEGLYSSSKVGKRTLSRIPNKTT